MTMNYSWVLDSGGAGRGAWQGGVLYEFMRWSREHGVFPSVSMGASAGGYAAADVATGTAATVMKGWLRWGLLSSPVDSSAVKNRFRRQLLDSLHYVMGAEELAGVFSDPGKRLLVFTTRIRRRDGKAIAPSDMRRFFLKSATRKLPGFLKYLPRGYVEEPVVFALNLPENLRSEHVRPLTRANYHRVIEASCLVPVAMGAPLGPRDVADEPLESDRNAVFIDGGYALKMPMRVFAEDARFRPLAEWAGADKTVVFCCDPRGSLWETSSRLLSLNTHPATGRAIAEGRLLVVHPDHKVEAGFLCTDNAEALRTFERGRDQGRRLLASDKVRRFFGM
ncbi:MAG: patatin-like phospholipase family protein [Acidobacteriota bacterium]|jgi:hypothetical protein|nr:patatin-like phospholipase family protein [Acidobacteriota bacterium]